MFQERKKERENRRVGGWEKSREGRRKEGKKEGRKEGRKESISYFLNDHKEK